MYSPRAGIHLVHKPVGPSSFSLVQGFVDDVRRAGVRPDKLPACHGGALDPFAEGLVLILAGKATRLMDQLHAIPKEYEATIAWGTETDSGDHLGNASAEGDASKLTPAALEAAVRDFHGLVDQVPPLHSNKRVDGERAYELAWRGAVAELPPSRVYLHKAWFIEHDLPRASRLGLVCGGGYYVRALARDLGRALGSRAHLRGLRRLAIGPWRDPPPEATAAEVVSGARLLPWLPSVQLGEREAARVLGGSDIAASPPAAPEWPLPSGFPAPPPLVRALRGDLLLALLSAREDRYAPAVRLGSGL